MEPIRTHVGVAVPLDAANIDTDQIIPKQFLLAVDRKGFGRHLFHEARWLDEAETQPNPDFILNKPVYAGASILVARENFGNGSSREHAPWALLDYGIRVVICTSFGDIFRNNALGNGLLTVTLPESAVAELFDMLEADPGMTLKVSLETMTVETGDRSWTFELDDFRRRTLMEGLDAMDLTLEHAAEIEAWEARQPAWRNRALLADSCGG